MKTILILSLMISLSASAKNKLASEDTSVKSAVNMVEKINSVVTNAIRPGQTCREEQVELPRNVQDKSSDLKVIVCRPDATSLTEPTGENYEQILRDYNIEFAGNKEEMIASRDFRLFIHELKKFPAPLMREMASRGGRIRLIFGNGVSEDPEWQVEKQRAVQLAARYRNWYNHQATPKQRADADPPISDAQAAAGFEVTTEGGRQWDVVSGAGGVFANPDAISPTRIVINRMYISAHREADGTISHNRMQGATNLFLHEHAHAMDNLYRGHTISHSEDWKRVMDDPKVKAYLPKIFDGSYEMQHAEEGFAEAFSYYHSCEASRSQMEREAPALAEYFRTFNVEKLRALRNAN